MVPSLTPFKPHLEASCGRCAWLSPCPSRLIPNSHGPPVSIVGLRTGEAACVASAYAEADHGELHGGGLETAVCSPVWSRFCGCQRIEKGRDMRSQTTGERTS